MPKDQQFIMTFQLSLIGLTLIGGLFLVWKGMSRIEEKVDLLMVERDMKACCPFKMELENSGLTRTAPQPTVPNPFETPIDQLHHDEEIKKLFGDEEMPDNGYIVFTAPVPPPAPAPTPAQAQAHMEPEAEPEPEQPPPPASVSSYSSDINKPLSRSKLRGLTIDKIKKICMERGLDSEGTKNQLIDRLLV